MIKIYETLFLKKKNCPKIVDVDFVLHSVFTLFRTKINQTALFYYKPPSVHFTIYVSIHSCPPKGTCLVSNHKDVSIGSMQLQHRLKVFHELNLSHQCKFIMKISMPKLQTNASLLAFSTYLKNISYQIEIKKSTMTR